MERYDIAIIGTGPAGLEAAITAIQFRIISACQTLAVRN